MNKEFVNDLKFSNEVLSIVDAVILVLDSNGRIVHFNKASESLTGYTYEEVQNITPWDIFVLPDEIDSVRNVFSQLTSGDFPNTHTNYWLTKQGEKRLINWSNTVITENGVINYIIATGIDVTEKKEAENKLEVHLNNLEDKVRERTVELTLTNKKLEKTLADLKTLKGIIPICGYCKSIRNDEGSWELLEKYVYEHSSAQFSHGICPICLKKELSE